MLLWEGDQMPSLVEIQYDPYRPNVSVLLNGKPPSAYSRLIQYSDEDLWKWADEILDVIYDELNDDFQLIFVGTDFDAAILEKQCENAPHCIGFRKHNFEVSDPLQNRMRRLNQLIKKSGLTSYQKSIIDACFYVPSAFQSLLEDILALDVNNLFCSVRAQILGAKLAYEETPTSVLFLLAEDYDSGYECLRKIRTEKPAYILIIDGGSGALKVTDKGLFLRTSREEFFRTLFECLLQVPLTTAFRNCVESIHGGGKITYELEKIRSTVPIVSVIVGNEVEVGKSIRLDFLIEPETAQLPGLVCKMQNQETASCNGFNVYGLKEGTSTLEVYRQGSGRPFFIKEIRVIQRNRITNLVLSEDHLLLGVGDQKQIELDYFPTDADNAEKISWESSNKEILSVDQNGCVTAVGAGECRVICTAENVSAQCICTVKPYMKELTILNVPESVLSMKPMQEVRIDYQFEPRDCIDQKLLMKSSDYDVVNVVNETLYAKKAGYAQVAICNESGRISRTLEVSVVEDEKPKKKVGFFQKLFS